MLHAVPAPPVWDLYCRTKSIGIIGRENYWYIFQRYQSTLSQVLHQTSLWYTQSLKVKVWQLWYTHLRNQQSCLQDLQLALCYLQVYEADVRINQILRFTSTKALTFRVLDVGCRCIMSISLLASTTTSHTQTFDCLCREGWHRSSSNPCCQV